VYEKGKWWFWNEIYTKKYGPYNSKDKAVKEFRKYVAIVINGKEE
jgi:hypothetical protein